MRDYFGVDLLQTLDETAEAAAGSSWYTPVTDMASDFGDWLSKGVDWMEANPTSAKMIGGAAAGAVSYYNQKQQQEHEEKMYQRRKSDKLELGRASSDSVTDGYTDYSSKLTGGTGLLTNGQLVKRT